MGLRFLYHRLRGRRKFIQFYANVTYSTPAECLKMHGSIFPAARELDLDDLNCPYHLLEFPVGELPEYREKKENMERLAQAELDRRRDFSAGLEKLEKRKYEEAVEYFGRAAETDVFLPEIEGLAEKFFGELSGELRRQLGEIFVNGYQEKFAQPRYERQPERMRIQREKVGVKKIKELLMDDNTSDTGCD